jgi:hypothetical protein
MTCICEFCNKEFNTNSLLQRHIKTAKYCLELRRRKEDLEIVINSDTVNADITKKFQCNSCTKEFTNKRNMIIHIENCKEVNVQKIKDNYNNKLLEKDEVIKQLESKIKNLEKILEIYKSDHECIQEIAKQPRINNNNTVNKYLNITPFTIKEREIERKVSLNFTEDNFLEGQKGIADFTYNNLLLDDNGISKYICKDINRGNFAYKNENGDIEIDYNADKLINIIHKDVIAKSQTIKSNGIKNSEEIEYKNKYIDNFVEIKELKTHNTKFVNRLGILTNRISSIPIIEDEIEKNIIPIDYEHMLEQSKFLTEDHIKEGINGYVKFALNYTFKNRVYCSDKNKNVLTYKIIVDNSNKFVDEIGGVKICIEFFKSIEEVNKKITEEIQKILRDQLSKVASNMTDGEYHKYEVIDDLLFEIDEQNSAIKYLSFGKETDFLHKFVQVLCNHF